MSNIQFATTMNNTYDEVPYESYPYAQSAPYHLMTLGALFGMQPTIPEEAKILELGCAAGGNLIPHAIHYPKSHCVGVDLSKTQIDEANKVTQELGLKNITFHHCSITDIDKSFGKFDYIICHGVISWVPEFVRDKIFMVCKDLLSENGIAYVSYNTLPGWNTVRTIRDMMLYHSNMFSNVREKIAQSRLLLDFVRDSLEGANTPYAEILKTEAMVLAKQSDHYLRHDHLEEENKQYYFHEFIKQAIDHDLQYLSDTNVSTMYLGNMPQKTAEKLQAVNDIVRTEQYMDFITNRRFRSTLLCHKSQQLNRTINNNDIMKFNMLLNVVPEKAIDSVDLNNSLESLNFFFNGNQDSKLSTSSPHMKAILYTFGENINRPINFDALIKSSNQKLGGNKLTEITNELLNNAMRLVLQGYLTITLSSLTKNDINLTKPKAATLPLYQVHNSNNLWVTNARHEPIAITLFEKYAMRYMNGKNNKKQIIDSLLSNITSGELVFNKDNAKVTDQQEISNELAKLLDAAIHRLSTNLVLT